MNGSATLRVRTITPGAWRAPFVATIGDRSVAHRTRSASVDTMLVWVTLLVGLVALVVGSVLMTRVDRRWRPLHQQCGRCGRAWFGHGKFCESCGARGRVHDWRGDTGPQATVPPPDRFGGFEPAPRALPAPRESLERRRSTRRVV